jgi:hypothetical protein
MKWKYFDWKQFFGGVSPLCSVAIALFSVVSVEYPYTEGWPVEELAAT